MNKPSLLLKAPVGSVSGYGSHARDIAWSLIQSKKFDIDIIPIRWGTLPLNALAKDVLKNNAIKSHIIQSPNIGEKRYDYFVHLTVPNEYEQIGKTNIGITAGIEVDRVAPGWLEKGNLMDLIIVPSHHSKLVYTSSSYMIHGPDKTKVIGQISCKTTVSVVFEGVDVEIYNNDGEKIEPLYSKLNEIIDTDFNFLFVGHWLPGDIGEDRKNVGKLIKLFNSAFDYNNNVGLILKTAIGPNSNPDRHRVIDRLKRTIDKVGYNYDSEKSPKIYIVHGTLTDSEMSQLYRHPKVNAFITLTHGEGYGRPMAEAAACDLPIIAPNWSGYIDFLDQKYTSLLDISMKQIPKSVVWPGILEEGSNWCDVEDIDVIKSMKDMYHNYKNWKELAKKQGDKIRNHWNLDKMSELLVKTILSASASSKIINKTSLPPTFNLIK